MQGGNGDDRFIIDSSNASGVEILDGGEGSDMLDLSSAIGSVYADLGAITPQIWVSASDAASIANANIRLAQATVFREHHRFPWLRSAVRQQQRQYFVWTGNSIGVADSYDGRTGSDTADFSRLLSIFADLSCSRTRFSHRCESVAVAAASTLKVANLASVENIIGTTGSDDIRGDANDKPLFQRRRGDRKETSSRALSGSMAVPDRTPMIFLVRT